MDIPQPVLDFMLSIDRWTSNCSTGGGRAGGIFSCLIMLTLRPAMAAPVPVSLSGVRSRGLLTNATAQAYPPSTALTRAPLEHEKLRFSWGFV